MLTIRVNNNVHTYILIDVISTFCIHTTFIGLCDKNKAFVFDAKYSPRSENMVAVALSDGTLRFIDISSTDNTMGMYVILCRHVMYTRILSLNHLFIIGSTNTSLPMLRISEKVHTTAVTWSNDGTTILVALGNGMIAVVDVRMVR